MKLGPALTLSQNPVFEMASNNEAPRSKLQGITAKANKKQKGLQDIEILANLSCYLEAATRFELVNSGFA
ncbi:MAG: hypothetical protein PVJ20_09050, partial [Desulfobacterales bacterium]